MIDFEQAVAEVRALEAKCVKLEAKVTFERKRADKAEGELRAFHRWYRQGPGFDMLADQIDAQRAAIVNSAWVKSEDGTTTRYQATKDGKPLWKNDPLLTAFFEERPRSWTDEDLVAFRLAFADEGIEMFEERRGEQ